MTRDAPTERARELRATQTPAETILWRSLRNRRLGGWKWRRQYPVGRYITDFTCLEASLIVELDGGQHSDAVIYDDRRTAFLESQGFRVLRFWNHEIFQHSADVCDVILRHCGGETPLTLPSPPGGRGGISHKSRSIPSSPPLAGERAG